MSYREEFKASITDPAAFWYKQAQQLAWYRAPQTILTTDQHGIASWFGDGELNTSYLALDHHIESGCGAQCAGMLAALGVGKGDRVLLYLPMVPEAVIAMLACARLGAIHSAGLPRTS